MEYHTCTSITLRMMNYKLEQPKKKKKKTQAKKWEIGSLVKKRILQLK